jgi:hypothetical protein
MCATRLRYTPTWRAPIRPSSWPYRGAGHAAQASRLCVASRLRRTARRLCYLDRPRTGLQTFGAIEFGRRKGKRRPAALRATRSRGSRMPLRLKPPALAAALIASACPAARRSQGRAHLLPDRSVTGLRQASETGHRLGFEYAAKGTREVDAVADEITGSKWNCYVFRTPRIALQDAVSNAVAIGKPGLRIATLAQGYGLGRDGVAAFKEALTMTGRRSTLRNMRRSTPSISPLPRSAFLRR